MKELQTDQFELGNCCFDSTQRDVITISTQIDDWVKEWKMKLPEIIFGDNSLTVTSKTTDTKLIISPQHILHYRCKETEFDPLKIVFKTSKEDDLITVFSDGYHWAFPSYAGAYGYDPKSEIQADGELPYDLLKRRDKIEWYKSFQLYEDDLHDFGLVVADCKIRVMPSYFYILLQQFLRIDRRVLYVINHRYFYKFNTDSVKHDFLVQKLDWHNLGKDEEHYLFEDVHNFVMFNDVMEEIKHVFTTIPFFSVYLIIQ